MRHSSPPAIGGASLPKRAASASATCPAGTIGVAGEPLGMISDWPGEPSTPPGPNTSAPFGEIMPAEGAALSNPPLPAPWANAAPTIRQETTSAISGKSRRANAAVIGGRGMTAPFSVEIAAISSQVDRIASGNAALGVTTGWRPGRVLSFRRIRRVEEPRQQISAYCLRRHRSAEIESLHLIGLGVVEEVDLARRFDTLHCHAHLHLAAERDNGSDHSFDV